MMLLHFTVAFAFLSQSVISQFSLEGIDPISLLYDMEYDVDTTTMDVALNDTKENSEKSRRDNLEKSERMEFEFLAKESENHHCQRSCEEGRIKTCKYHFIIEPYSVMSKACFDCPYNISNCNMKFCIAGDGVKRAILSVNRQMPGPAIEVCYGDRIEVKVTNRLFDINTSIHWHGILQKETPFMDGVPFISQCPITPQTSFLYKFVADTPGTHIWHSHSAFQRGDGIYGPLVVRVPEGKDPHWQLYDYDLYEHTFTIMDWEHLFSANKFSLHLHSNEDNKPSTILVNGKGRFEKFYDEENVIFTPVETFNVKKESRYRFRLINAGFLNCPIEMSIDNHTILIIATDGENIEPMETTSLVSLAGERFDFIVNANQNVSNYWIRFKGLLDCSPKKAFQVAVLHYEGAKMELPTEKVTYETANRAGLQVNSINVPVGHKDSILISELSSLPEKPKNPALKPVPDFKFYIAYDFYPLDNPNFQYSPAYGFYMFPENQRVLTPQINHISMEFPTFVLMADLEKSRNLKTCNSSSVSLECRFEYCECTHVIRIPLNAVVELILIDEGLPYEANHPFHLHGFKFYVVGSDRIGNNTREENIRKLDNEGKLKRNLNNPPLKDTVSTPDGGYSILRFHAVNPGYWLFHCHIDFHVEMGMALLFKIGDDHTYKSPPKDFPKCYDYLHSHQNNNSHEADFLPKNLMDDKVFYTVHTSFALKLYFKQYWYLIIILCFLLI